MKILITGCSGFIGYHLAKNLLVNNDNLVYGIDSLNDYYDPQLKLDRLHELGISQFGEWKNGEIITSNIFPNFSFTKLSLEDSGSIINLFKEENFDVVVNLAAQAGVRYSLENPQAYIDSNIQGFINILEACRNYPVKHLVYASSSSVYGNNKKIPFATTDNVDNPISLYAATKKSNELMAHTYSHLFGIPTTGLRFFTVYGPWGRPDMAYFSFTKNILEGNPISVFNHGNMKRDFTYIDDIVDGIVRVINHPPISKVPNVDSEIKPPYKIYNIGNNKPIELKNFIETLEKIIGKKADKINKGMQPGDVPMTYADIDDIKNEIGFEPRTDIESGLSQFVKWFRSYYKK